MSYQSKLIQITALSLMTSAIALVTVESIATPQFAQSQATPTTQCNNTCRRATVKAAARFGRMVRQSSSKDKRKFP